MFSPHFDLIALHCPGDDIFTSTTSIVVEVYMVHLLHMKLIYLFCMYCVVLCCVVKNQRKFKRWLEGEGANLDWHLVPYHGKCKTNPILHWVYLFIYIIYISPSTGHQPAMLSWLRWVLRNYRDKSKSGGLTGLDHKSRNCLSPFQNKVFQKQITLNLQNIMLSG